MEIQISVKEEEIKKVLETVLSEKGIKNYKIIFSNKSENGEGYMGDVIFVSVEENQPKRKYNFVLKCEKRCREIRNLMPVESAFSNELFCYQYLFPNLKQFLKEKGHHCLEYTLKTPLCHKIINNFNDMKIIVLDNLKVEGYKMYNSQHPVNKDHIGLFLKDLGKFHALGFVFRREKPELFKHFAEKLDDVYAKIQKGCLSIRNKVKEMVENLIKEKSVRNWAKINDLFKNSVKHLADVGDVNDPFSVIVHGDCWINNLLYKYDDKGKPISVVLLDWQMTKIASPIIDLSFFLFSSCSKEEFSNFNEFLRIYYNSVAGYLRILGYDPENYYSFETFLSQWRKFNKYGLLMMPILLTFCFATSDEKIDFLEFARKKIKIEDELFLQVMQNRKEEYLERVYSVLNFYGEHLDE